VHFGMKVRQPKVLPSSPLLTSVSTPHYACFRWNDKNNNTDGDETVWLTTHPYRETFVLKGLFCASEQNNLRPFSSLKAERGVIPVRILSD